MAARGVYVNQVVSAQGAGEGAALAKLIEAVSADGDYRAVQVANNRVQFARTFRPTWAIVTGCVLGITILGLAFFFIKTTETCLAVVESDHTGTRIRLTGRLRSAVLGRINSAFSGPAATPSTMASTVGAPTPSALGAQQGVSFAPPDPSSAVPPAPLSPSLGMPTPPATSPSYEEVSTVRPARPLAFELNSDGAASQASPNTPVNTTAGQPDRIPTAYVLLDDGSRFALAEVNLLGRDPSLRGEEVSANLLSIEDSTKSVSKTHLAIRRVSNTWFVEDLHSTNGVRIPVDQGADQMLEPGTPQPLLPGATVQFGNRSLRLMVEG